MASNYPPGVTGFEPQIVGYDPEVELEVEDVTNITKLRSHLEYAIKMINTDDLTEAVLTLEALVDQTWAAQ